MTSRDDEHELDERHVPIDRLVGLPPDGTDRAPRRGGPVRPAHARVGPSWAETWQPPPRPRPLPKGKAKKGGAK